MLFCNAPMAASRSRCSCCRRVSVARSSRSSSLVIAAVPQARAFGQRTGLGRPRGGYGLPQMSDQIRNFRREATPRRPGKSRRLRVFQYPVLGLRLQAAWRFAYELTIIAALHNECDVTDVRSE